MTVSERPLESHLQAALREAEDDETRYHLREAIQLRIADRTLPDAN